MTPRFAPLVDTLLLAFSRLPAVELPNVQFTADNLVATDVGMVGTGEGSGLPRLAYRDIVLYADSITYDRERHEASAAGNVVLIRGAQRLVADQITYRLADGTYTVGRFRAGQGDYLVSGAKAEGSRTQTVVSDVTLTHGEPDPYSPALRARTVTYTEGATREQTEARLEGARIGVGAADILPLPTLSETPRDPTLASFDARLGFSGNLGAEVSVAATTNATSEVELGGDLGIFTKRGVLVGPIGNYDTMDAQGIGARGLFRTGFIQDQGDREEDIRDEPIREERGYVEWQHHQKFENDLTLSGQVYYWSDSYVTRDFRPDNFYDLQTPDSWLEVQGGGDNFVVSLFTRVQVNNYSLIQERLPELRFDGLPVELGGGLYHRVNASAAALKEDDPITGVTTHSNRLDLYYGAYRPFSPREWLTITPTAGTRVTHYARPDPASDRGHYTRVLGEVGFDAKLFESSATWDYRNERWGIDGLRHIVTPTLAYRYSPSADVGRAYIPRIDDDVFNTYLRPLGLADRREVDRLPALNTFRVGVDNVLQTRARGHGSRDLVRLSLAVDQHADSEAAATQGTSRDQSDAHAFLALTPAPWLRFDVYNRTTLQTGQLQELNTGLTVRDADIWSLRVGTHYLEQALGARQIQEYSAAYGLRLSEIYSMVARVRLDSRTGEFTEQSLALSQRLSRFWTLHYEVAAYDGPRREDDFGFGVTLESESF